MLSRRMLLGAAGGAFGAAFLPVRLTLAAEGSPQPINIVTSNSNLTNCMLEVAKKKRFLEDLGLAPTLLAVNDGSKVIPSLLSGGSDFCTVNGISLVFPAVARGGKLKLVGGSCLLAQLAVYSAKPGITSIKDLEGKSIGTGALGALTHQIMVALLKKKGVDPAKVIFRNVGNNADIFRAVATGTVDAGPSGLDVYDQMAKFKTHVLADGNVWEELPEYTYQGAFTSDRAIDAKRDALIRALAGFAKLYRYIQAPESHDDFVAGYIAATGSKGDASEAESTWKFIQRFKPYSTDIVLSDERVRYMQQINVDMGVQTQVLPVAQVSDTTLAKDALKLL